MKTLTILACLIILSAVSIVAIRKKVTATPSKPVLAIKTNYATIPPIKIVDIQRDKQDANNLVVTLQNISKQTIDYLAIETDKYRLSLGFSNYSPRSIELSKRQNKTLLNFKPEEILTAKLPYRDATKIGLTIALMSSQGWMRGLWIKRVNHLTTHNTYWEYDDITSRQNNNRTEATIVKVSSKESSKLSCWDPIPDEVECNSYPECVAYVYAWRPGAASTIIEEVCDCYAVQSEHCDIIDCDVSFFLCAP